MIGIIGGTFDPIHFGHLRPALEITEKLSLRECRFIPSARPPHRWQPQASAAHRLNMVKLAIKKVPEFVLDDREYHQKGASYTIDTIRSIREEIGDEEPLSMIIGTDAFLSFTQWKDWDKILKLTHLVIATRPGYEDNEKSADWVKSRIETDEKKLHQEPCGKVYFCDVTQLEISATYVREQLDKGFNCQFLTPKKVQKYIEKKNLYTSWS